MNRVHTEAQRRWRKRQERRRQRLRQACGLQIRCAVCGRTEPELPLPPTVDRAAIVAFLCDRCGAQILAAGVAASPGGG